MNMDIKLMPKLAIEKGKTSYGLNKEAAADFSQLENIKKNGGGPFLYLAVGLLAIAVLTCLGLWGYQIFLNNQKADLDKKIEELNNQRDLKLEAKFALVKESIDNLTRLVERRTYPINLFNLLEQLTLAQVWFPNFRADFTKGEMDLDIETVNYNTMAKQISIFEQDSRIKKVEANDFGLGETGGVTTKIRIDFLPSSLVSQ